MKKPTPTGEPSGDQIAKLINDTVDDLESLRKENDKLREQLDAAVEALRDLYENPSPKTARKAQSVLAEVADEHP